MKTCGQCKELDCSGLDEHPNAPACDDFTGEAFLEEQPEWRPTLKDYTELAGDYDRAQGEIVRLTTRIAGYERAVADLVKFAQEEKP